MKKNSSIVSICFHASIWPAFIVVLLTITLSAIFYRHHIHDLYNRETNRHELIEQLLLNAVNADVIIENNEAIVITLDTFKEKYQLNNLYIFDHPFYGAEFDFFKFLRDQTVRSTWTAPGLYPQRFIYITSIVDKRDILIPFLTSIFVIFLFIVASCLMYTRIKKKLYHQIVIPLDQTLNYERTGKECISLGSAASEIINLYKKTSEFAKTLHQQRDIIEEQNIERARYRLALQVAHDIRSPVLALKAVSASSSDINAQCKQIIQNVTNRISQIADDILKQHNRPSTANLENDLCAQPVSKVISQIIDEKKAVQLNPNITFDLNIDNSSFDQKANISEEYLYRIFTNIINNAIESISRIGTITIDITSDSEKIYVTITDTGCGIARNWLKDIFRPGFTKNKASGNGLGLSYAKCLLESRRGKIKLDSIEGKGTSVMITLRIA